MFKVLEFYYTCKDISEEFLFEISWIVNNILACGEKVIGLVLKSNLTKKFFEIPIKYIRNPTVSFILI